MLKPSLYQGILLYIFIYLYYLAQFFVLINARRTRAPFAADLYWCHKNCDLHEGKSLPRKDDKYLLKLVMTLKVNVFLK